MYRKDLMHAHEEFGFLPAPQECVCETFRKCLGGPGSQEPEFGYVYFAQHERGAFKIGMSVTNSPWWRVECLHRQFKARFMLAHFLTTSHPRYLERMVHYNLGPLQTWRRRGTEWFQLTPLLLTAIRSVSHVCVRHHYQPRHRREDAVTAPVFAYLLWQALNASLHRNDPRRGRRYNPRVDWSDATD